MLDSSYIDCRIIMADCRTRILALQKIHDYILSRMYEQKKIHADCIQTANRYHNLINSNITNITLRITCKENNENTICLFWKIYVRGYMFMGKLY